MKKRSLSNRIVIFICILVIIGSAIGLFYSLYPLFKSKMDSDEIVNVAKDGETIDWAALQAINPDVVGWVELPGTHINYPVVQTTDNDYYLDHNFNQEYDPYGVPFLDYIYDMQKEPRPQNTVVYAHNSPYGNLVGFQGFDKYTDQSYYQSHPYFYYTSIKDGPTPVRYDIVAAIEVPYDFDYRQTDFNDQTEFLNYFTNVLSNKFYDTGQVIYADDQIVTLSTCGYDINNGRIVLVGRRADIDPTKAA